jgi:hypothetical protein
MKSDSSNKNKKYTETPHERKRMPSTKTTWGHVADWYEEHLLGKDTYHKKGNKQKIDDQAAALILQDYLEQEIRLHGAALQNPKD